MVIDFPVVPGPRPGQTVPPSWRAPDPWTSAMMIDADYQSGDCRAPGIAAFARTTDGCRITRRLVDRTDQVLDLFRVRAELFRKLVEIGIGDRDEALLV